VHPSKCLSVTLVPVLDLTYFTKLKFAHSDRPCQVKTLLTTYIVWYQVRTFHHTGCHIITKNSLQADGTKHIAGRMRLADRGLKFPALKYSARQDCQLLYAYPNFPWAHDSFEVQFSAENRENCKVLFCTKIV
jgi:hypothetical protein